jgi:hypothetical protein
MPAILKLFLDHQAPIPNHSLISSITVFQLILRPAKRTPNRAHHSLATKLCRRELDAFGFVSCQQRLSCRADGFHCGLLLKQREWKAKTLARTVSRALVSFSLYRRLMVSLSQPLKLTLTKKVFGILRPFFFDLPMLKLKLKVLLLSEVRRWYGGCASVE